MTALSSSCVPPEQHSHDVAGLLPLRYAAQNVLHESAISVLYQAKDSVTGLAVVLKVFEPEQQAFYLREIGASFGTHHPNLVPCIDTFYLSDGRPCIVYEYISGGTLQGWLERSAPIPDMRQCLRELLGALQYLHQQQRIHCDLKPANVFLRSESSTDYILGDLGAACFIREAQQQGHRVGTPAYMAPERFYDRFYFNSDLYSLGVLAYELCTGMRPFQGSTEELVHAHLREQPDFNRIPDLALRDFVAQLLEKDPAKRISNAATALYILNHLGTSVDALPPPATSTAKAALPPPLHTGFLQPYAEYKIREVANKVYLGSLGEQPILGLAADSHIEWLDPRSGQTQHLILTSTDCLILADKRIAYLTGHQLFRQALNSRARESLASDCIGLRYFSLSGPHLLWRDQTAWHYRQLDTHQQCSFRHNNYFLSAQGCVLEDRYLLLSDGSANHKLRLRDQQGECLQTWQLDGPVLELTANEDTALVLTIDCQDQQQYSLWQVDAQSIEKISLPRGIKYWFSTLGHFFWLTLDDRIFMCDQSLQIHLLGTLPRASVSLSISPDHRFIATLDPAGDCLRVWQNKVFMQ